MAHAQPLRFDDLDAAALLSNDHRTVEQLLDRLERGGPAEQRRSIVHDLVRELRQHTLLEERVLYPRVREIVDGGPDLAANAVQEHAAIIEVLERLEREAPSGPGFAESARTLREAIARHVDTEENEVFPRLRLAAGAHGLFELGRSMSGLKGAARATGHAG